MINLARFFESAEKFEKFKEDYPIDGTLKEKYKSKLANALRNETLSVMRLNGSTIENSNNYDEIIEGARNYINAEHGSVFALVFELDGQFYACIESTHGKTTKIYVEIDARNNLESVCDAVYRGNGVTLMF